MRRRLCQHGLSEMAWNNDESTKLTVWFTWDRRTLRDGGAEPERGVFIFDAVWQLVCLVQTSSRSKVAPCAGCVQCEGTSRCSSRHSNSLSAWWRTPWKWSQPCSALLSRQTPFDTSHFTNDLLVVPFPPRVSHASHQAPIGCSVNGRWKRRRSGSYRIPQECLNFLCFWQLKGFHGGKHR